MYDLIHCFTPKGTEVWFLPPLQLVDEMETFAFYNFHCEHFKLAALVHFFVFRSFAFVRSIDFLFLSIIIFLRSVLWSFRSLRWSRRKTQSNLLTSSTKANRKKVIWVFFLPRFSLLFFWLSSSSFRSFQAICRAQRYVFVFYGIVHGTMRATLNRFIQLNPY